MSSTLDRYLAALADADAAEGVDALRTAADAGTPVKRLVREVLARGQVHVGEQWFRGTWTVADSHAATAVAERALAALVPPRERAPSAVRAVLACAEGEWHSLPARLAAELASDPSLDVVVLGASVPADDLSRHLVAHAADVLLLSATLPTNLVAASRSIAAAHDAGVPVVVGGAAWGRGQHRARALGADLHVEDPAALPEVLPPLLGRPLAAPVPVPVSALLLDAPPPEVLLVAFERQRAASPWAHELQPYQRERALRVLEGVVRHAAAAVACDDPQVVGEHLRWLVALLGPRGVPVDAVLDGPLYLADALAPGDPDVATMLRGQVRLVRDEVGAEVLP